MLLTFISSSSLALSASALRHFEHFDDPLAQLQERVVPHQVERLAYAFGLNEAVAVQADRVVAGRSVGVDDDAVPRRRADIDERIADRLEPLRPPFVRGVRRCRRSLIEQQEALHCSSPFGVVVGTKTNAGRGKWTVSRERVGKLGAVDASDQRQAWQRRPRPQYVAGRRSAGPCRTSRDGMSGGQSTAVASSMTRSCGAGSCATPSRLVANRLSEFAKRSVSVVQCLSSSSMSVVYALSRTMLARVMSAPARTAARLSTASSSCAAMSPGCWGLPSATASCPLQTSSRWCPSMSWAWSNPKLIDQGQGLMGFRSMSSSYISSWFGLDSLHAPGSRSALGFERRNGLRPPGRRLGASGQAQAGDRACE